MKQKGFIEWINVIWGDLFYIFIILCFIIIFLFFLVGDNYSTTATPLRITQLTHALNILDNQTIKLRTSCGYAIC